MLTILHPSACAIMLINCSEDPLHSANGSDGIAARKRYVVNSVVKMLQEGLLLQFTPPTDADLAVY